MKSQTDLNVKDLNVISVALCLFQGSSHSRNKRDVTEGGDSTENKGVLSSLFSDKRKFKILVKTCLPFTDLIFLYPVCVGIFL